MKWTRIFRIAAVALATCGLVAPPSLVQAAPPAEPVTGPANGRVSDERRAVDDVALSDGGIVTGQLVDSAGVPVAGAVVHVLSGGRNVGQVATDEQGQFAVAGLGGGVHQLVAGQALYVARLWTPGAAPPSASQSVMMVAPRQAVLGQRDSGWMGCYWENIKCWLTDPLIVGGIVAAAIAIPVVVHNADRDRASGS